jgi:hypothetical protein
MACPDMMLSQPERCACLVCGRGQGEGDGETSLIFHYTPSSTLGPIPVVLLLPQSTVVDVSLRFPIVTFLMGL